MSYKEEHSPLLTVHSSPPKNLKLSEGSVRRTGAPQLSDTITSRRAAYGGKRDWNGYELQWKPNLKHLGLED
eukprot:jgi/Galph1/2417/GphlegSOOS_G1047.1